MRHAGALHLDGSPAQGEALKRAASSIGPMANQDKTVWLTYNREIYNFRELRRLLAARGHVSASHCDGEVLVHGYDEWGRDLVERLNGIFAFAIWDARERRLFLARDPFGAKPLYYRLAVFVLALVRLWIVRRAELVDVARALRLRAGAS